MPREQLYQKYAKYYDKIYAGFPYEEQADFVVDIIEEYGIESRDILDVACGTGSLAKLLHERGYAVTGVDKHSEMLDIAREKTSKVPFKKGNMKTLDLSRKYDVLTCFFTSINYNTSENELRKTLNAFYETLRGGGVAIFDLALTNGEFGDCNLEIHSEGSLQIARVMQWVPSGGKEEIINVNSLILVKEGKGLTLKPINIPLGGFRSKQ